MQNDFDLDYDLAKEFGQVKRAHMVRVCTNALVYDMEQEAQKGLNLPIFLVRDKIEQEAVTVISSAIRTQKIQELYDKCWTKVIEENLVI